MSMIMEDVGQRVTCGVGRRITSGRIIEESLSQEVRFADENEQVLGKAGRTFKLERTAKRKPGHGWGTGKKTM